MGEESRQVGGGWVLTLSVASGADAEGAVYSVGDGGCCEDEGNAGVEGSGWKDSARGRTTDADGSSFAIDVDGDRSDDGFPKEDTGALGDERSITDLAGVRNELRWVSTDAEECWNLSRAGAGEREGEKARWRGGGGWCDAEEIGCKGSAVWGVADHRGNDAGDDRVEGESETKDAVEGWGEGF